MIESIMSLIYWWRYVTMNIKTRFLLGIASLLLIFPITIRVFAIDGDRLSGKLEVDDCCVTVVNPDGSIVNLDVGATYPLFLGLILATDETGKVSLKVPDGRYVIFPNSEYTVKDIGAGNAGLAVSEAKMGKACYCFSREGQYSIDSTPADLKNYLPRTTTPGSGVYIRESSLGLTSYVNGVSYAAQWQGESQFDSEILQAGDAVCKPSCDDPREGLGGFIDCCAPDLVPYWVGGSAAAAAVAGSVVAATVTSDKPASTIIPPGQ
jgi:hypothetical protein